MKDKLYELRNGIVVKACNLGNVNVVSIPTDYKGSWKVGHTHCLYAPSENPLEWEGISHGESYDVVREVGGGVMKARVRMGLKDTSIGQTYLDKLEGTVIEVQEVRRGRYRGAGWLWKEEWLDFDSVPVMAMVKRGLPFSDTRDGFILLDSMRDRGGEVHEFTKEGNLYSRVGCTDGVAWVKEWLDFNYDKEEGVKSQERQSWEAVVKSERMWEFIAVHGCTKREAMRELFYGEKVKEDCWLCQYVKDIQRGCRDCPLMGMWGGTGRSSCTNSESPFTKWGIKVSKESPEARSAAWEMVKLHRDWLDSHPEPTVNMKAATKFPKNITRECTGKLISTGDKAFMEISWPGRKGEYKVVAHIGMTDKPVVNDGFEVERVGDTSFKIYVTREDA